MAREYSTDGRKYIVVKGARQHNLKNIDLKIPHNTFTVITGPSGSGKSSLAFDILYAEGQRRYIESLSTYARQFIEQLDKPDVDLVEGLSPTIAIENKQIATNPRSTVGTITEIYDFLRLLFSRLGKAHCPACRREIRISYAEDTVNELLKNHLGAKVMVLSPVRVDSKNIKKVLQKLEREGFIRIRLDGKIYEIHEILNHVPDTVGRLEIVIDRLVVDPEKRSRITDSVELAYRIGEGKLVIFEPPDKELLFTEKYACDLCGIKLPEPSPRLFSFNNPEGACPRCDGLGFEESFDPELIISNPELSIREGAILPWEKKNSVTFYEQLESLARHYKFDIDLPFKDLPKRAKEALLFGSGNEEIPFFHYRGNRRFVHRRKFPGIIPFFKQKLKEAKTLEEKKELEQYIRKNPCSLCNGTRLKKEALSFTYHGLTISDISTMSVKEAHEWFKSVASSTEENPVAVRITSEILTRLELLLKIGLHYITLDRPANTLSGGETQRIRLANQIGSKLVGVTYILDEPTVGLHPYDQHRLLETILSLRDIGNTVIVVEHDRETIMSADYVVDIGPAAGVRGGEIIFTGSPGDLLKNKQSLTGKYLKGSLKVYSTRKRRKPTQGFLKLRGASSFNLKNIDVDIPLGVFTCITGVSGSGKSTLLFHTLYKSLKRFLYGQKNIQHGQFESLEGWEKLHGVIHISQGPIGKSPRSNPATYIGLFSQIRSLLARLPESRTRGYSASRFSFNVKGGRCETCKGDGQLKIQMHFLPDIYVTCPSCEGKRYNKETLEIRYKGKNIAEILDLTVNQALEHFANIPSFQLKLQLLKDVGLGYIKLGQPANTLSTGESQRVKLAKELTRRSGSSILFLLDEPTTGLHLDDINRLLQTLHMLVDRGNTVVIIEHNMDFVSSADWVIDLGPGGGDEGGTVVAQGEPEVIAQNELSLTGRYLKKLIFS
ncbi:MAG: excinuclease ABC subunit UvrA [Deltaproteobacteria bacterium]|nr:MAG: excinuclease ABC subunit UvrA [Deltaproteobacteria bacterium]